MKVPSKTQTKNHLVQDVWQDFEKRRTARKPLELMWQLNIDFLRGNQNNYITNMGNIIQQGKQFYWQQREVFNHISPLIESRLAKITDALKDVSITTVPLTNDPKDIKRSEICDKILKAASSKIDIKNLIDQACMWSELTGTAFYKVIWNSNAGKIIGDFNGKPLHEGDVNVIVCSPFEIYPDTLTSGSLSEMTSIIHAKPYTTGAIREIWGVDVVGEDIEIYDFNRTSTQNQPLLENSAMVIERYQNGRLTIVAGEKLLYDGEHKGIPFVRQLSETLPGTFYGKSVIERVIPVQRAYNAVKNRKTEFLNRLACGVLLVEDGSVELETLENEGLAPGAVISYRHGTTAPVFIDSSKMPLELEREEERLLREFATITGGTGMAMHDSSIMSGVALEILVTQENQRMRRAIESVRNALKQIARHILGLYKNFGGANRIERLSSGKNVELFAWSEDDITTDEITVE